MDRAELKRRVEELAREAKASGEMAAAGVLLTLSGSLHAKTERALLNKCAEHSQAELSRLHAHLN